MRLPIGYWAFDVSAGEPYIQGQLPYLTKAVNWAQNHGLKLIVDLHGKKPFTIECDFFDSYQSFQGFLEARMGLYHFFQIEVV